MNPFRYCKKPHTWKHGPSGYANYRGFKQWLRDEFSFRCVYCLHREAWSQDGGISFGVDHVIPQSANRSLVNEYGNLVYACQRCNIFKRDQDLGIDPSQLALDNLLQVDERGCITATDGNALGQLFIRALRLDHPHLTEFRRRTMELLRRLKAINNEEARQLIKELLAFPSDLPNLARSAPPGANRKAGSEQQSHYARKTKRQLPSTYLCCGQ